MEQIHTCSTGTNRDQVVTTALLHASVKRLAIGRATLAHASFKPKRMSERVLVAALHVCARLRAGWRHAVRACVKHVMLERSVNLGEADYPSVIANAGYKVRFDGAKID